MELEVIQHSEMFEMQPDRGETEQALFRAMKQPPPEMGQKPHRTAQVIVEATDWADTRRPDLTSLGIAVNANDLSMLDEVYARPAKGVTPELAGGRLCRGSDLLPGRTETQVVIIDVDSFAGRR